MMIRFDNLQLIDHKILRSIASENIDQLDETPKELILEIIKIENRIFDLKTDIDINK